MDVLHIDRSAVEEGRLSEPEESYGVDAHQIAIEDCVAQREYLLKNEPVAKLVGNEFERQEGKKLTQQVGEYFTSIGGKAISQTLGEVILDERGAEDSLAHGIGREKAIAYAAVKDVIENGVVVQEHTNHKGRGYNTAMIIAPIMIGDERYVCCVVVRKNAKESRYYLHEVTAQKNLQEDAFITNLAQKPASFGDVANVLKEIITAKKNEENVTAEHEEGYGLNGDASADAAELAAYDAGRMSLAERAAQAVAAMSAKNRADVEARREAVKALGGNLQKLRQAMARQREYDKGTVDAIVRQARIMLEGGMLDGMTRGEVKKLLSLVA